MIRFFATLSTLLFAIGALAQDKFPGRQINMVVGFAPGGGTDTASRIIARKFADNLGVPVVVDNKSGAGGNIATDFVAKAAPDGYTILLAAVGSLAVSPHMIAKLPYDPKRDLEPLTMAVVFPNVLVIHPSVPANDLAELVALARKQPGTVTYGSSGIGGAGHLAGELFRLVAKIDIVHVPYKGGGPAVADLLGGQITAVFATPASAGTHVKAGKLRALATTGPKRSPFLPDTPTIAESGYPGYEATNWYAYMAPARTPPALLERLHRELVKVLSTPEIREQLHNHGLEAQPGSREELARYIEREYATWGRVVRDADIKAN